MPKFVLNIPTVQTDICQVEIEAPSIDDAIDAALNSEEGKRTIIETILCEPDPEEVEIVSTGAINLVGYKWNPLKKHGKITH